MRISEPSRSLDARRVPSGLAALARRCLDPDPSRRYANGTAVAEDIRRWLADGVTLAQEATRWELAWLRLRRSPRAITGFAVATVAVLLAIGAWQYQGWRERSNALTRMASIATATDLERREAVAVALDEVRAIRARLPGLAEAQALEARLQTASDLAARRDQLARVRARLDTLLHRTRTHGPWADQVQAWRQAIRDAGLTMDAEQVAEDVRRLDGHPLREPIVTALPFLWRAEKERGADFHAASTAKLLADAGATPGWQALGRLLDRTVFAAHDPVFCVCADSSLVLTEPAPTAAALALFASEPRLTAAAREALLERPGDFWALIAVSRANLATGDKHAAEHLALIASGAEPESLLPQLLLAYVAMQRDDTRALDRHVAAGLRLAPDNTELAVLQAVALARLGHKTEAQTVVDSLDPRHLQYHLHHAVGHPMEHSVRALLAAGLHLPDAPPVLGPLTPAAP